MIIEIDENNFNQVLKIVKLENTTLYNQIKDIKPLNNLNQVDTLATARTVKTERIKESIKSTLRELIQSNINPTKYKVHKYTNIAYITLAKYYDEILDEVLNEQ
ncbi:MAG: hypothetical protein DRG78_10270 [Epsilonproteobacteria bacterium]|nr:MAG: hypothetical protein DRG78_10270 [Campylobacterota bacterium]